jgi:DHA3 family macrolide efflux protein-like MFS transporter
MTSSGLGLHEPSAGQWEEHDMAVISGPFIGMQNFAILWFGQVISVLGTQMTSFAIALWAWEMTGSATALSLLIFFAIGPAILLGPAAGAIVDRGNRKLLIILADAGAGLSTAALLLLYATGHLQIWHVYGANLLAGICQAFQGPAFSASITLLVPKEQYSRANGMMSLVHNIPEIAAPLLAGILTKSIGVDGIMIIDLLTFAFAVATAAAIHIPQPLATSEGQGARSSLWSESIYGFRYILKRPGLLGLQLAFLLFNLAGVFQWALQSPMILARTGQDARLLGTVLAALGVGGVAGGLLMSTWGGPKRKIHGVLGGMALDSTLGILLFGLGRVLPVWTLAAFFLMFFVPIINSSNQAIWQAKVAPDLQGRVFAARRVIAQFSYLVGFLVAGPLADRLFEPAMQPGGALAGTFGGLVGTGPGAGMALLVTAWGLLGIALSLTGYLFPSVRNVESTLPDALPSVSWGEGEFEPLTTLRGTEGTDEF